MSPEWLTAVGGVALGALRLGYDIWKGTRGKKGPAEHSDDDQPPRAAAA